MKGVVFNLLETIVVREYGEETWDELLDCAGVDGVYTTLGSYPDEDFFSLVGAATSVLELDADDIVRWFGRSSMPLFAERYPHLFTPHVHTRAFVMTLNDIIHPEVRKLYPGAIVPEFDFDASDPVKLVMGYRSPRKLCAFAEGLLLGAGDHFGETVAVAQPRCMKHGEPECRLVITFGP